MKIAVSGKGGVGKTTVAANLVHCFTARGFQVYAVDADPDASLGMALGLDPRKLDRLRPLIEMKELVDERNAGGGAFVSLNPRVDDLIDQYSIEEGLIRFIRMGGIKQGGSACYCQENAFLQAVLDSLLLEKQQAVVLDMSAGIEHLTRGTSQGVDLLLVVTEPTQVSIKTARIVIQLAGELGISRVSVLGNKVRLDAEKQLLEQSFGRDQLLGFIPFADHVLSRALDEKAPLLQAADLLPGINRMFEQLLRG